MSSRSFLKWSLYLDKPTPRSSPQHSRTSSAKSSKRTGVPSVETCHKHRPCCRRATSICARDDAFSEATWRFARRSSLAAMVINVLLVQWHDSKTLGCSSLCPVSVFLLPLQIVRKCILPRLLDLFVDPRNMATAFVGVLLSRPFPHRCSSAQDVLSLVRKAAEIHATAL